MVKVFSYIRHINPYSCRAPELNSKMMRFYHSKNVTEMIVFWVGCYQEYAFMSGSGFSLSGKLQVTASAPQMRL